MKAKGFTLIELMIVVAIVGILAAIAYPAYTNHVRQTHRGNAQAEMLQLAQAMERCAARTRSYATCLPASSVPVPAQNARYTISIDQPPAHTSFTIRAIPTNVGGQNTDPCGTMTINHRGERTPVATATISCWN